MPKKAQASLQGMSAVIYARYSSHSQNDASIEQQVAKCEEYAARVGLTIIHTYPDRAMTGRNDRRPEFQKMMKDAAKGKFQCVVAWKSNRMGRNMLEAMVNDAKLMDHGVRCLYVEEDFGDNAAGRFALRNMMNVNQFYSENMAEDITRGLHDAASQGKVIGSIPLGYKKGEDGCYAIDTPMAEVVREIFNRIAGGESLAAIADDLNSRHITTAHGKPWGKNSFHSITKNEKYIGIYSYSSDIRNDGGVPSIVDEATFRKVQTIMGRRKEVAGRRNANEDYILTGKLFCGLCGSPMTGISGTGKSGAMHFYYICRRRRIDHNCTKENVRKDIIERTIARILKNIVLRDEVIEWMADAVMRFQDKLREESRLSYYRTKLDEVQHSLSNIMKAIESGVFSTTVQTRLTELEKEEKQLVNQIDIEQSAFRSYTRDQIIFYMQSFRNGDADSPAFQRSLFDTFLESVYLYDDHVKIVFNYTKGENELDIPLLLDDSAPSDAECSFNASFVP